MFRNRAQLLGWRFENGQHIEARVLVTLYEARGDFQLNIETARKAGIGNLYEEFLRLKDKLERQGLFALEHKRKRPAFPRCIGIITSPQAAALRDVLTTLTRRAPHIRTILYPTAVQGEAAAQQIAGAIRRADQRRECDVLIVCRGGGSLEDLWAFNDEELAQAIRTCAIPIITGIGHETDFTIADFAADQRAPTPTAAAELAAPERSVLMGRLFDLRLALYRQIERHLGQHGQIIDGIARRLQHPAQHLTQQREYLLNLQRRLDGSLALTHAHNRNVLAGLTQRLLLARPDAHLIARQLESLTARLTGEWQKSFSARTGDLTRITSSLAHLNPHEVLARGYSIVTDEAGKILRSSQTLEPNDRITVSFHTGRAEAKLTRVSK
jgi:exodeoxyribonuclease VII large subunit